MERLVGVDAARGVALLGMTAVHVLPAQAADGGTTPAHLVAAGRSAALFAVLAGVSVALLTGGPRRSASGGTALALVVRGLLIGVVGLVLGGLGSGVAVILSYYAVLFVLAVPLLRLRPAPLLGLAAVVAVGMPVVSQAVRRDLEPGLTQSPTVATLVEQPGRLLETVLLTGYYPVLAWTAYLCVGLAVGQLALRDRAVAVRLLVGGAVLAVTAAALSTLLLQLRGYEAIGLPAQQVQEGRYGTVPTTTWWWLATDAPHSTTPLDLLHTTGTALVVLGAALLLGRRLTWLAGAGSMPLTLYSAHVLLLSLVDSRSLLFWLTQVVVGLVVGHLWRQHVGRGPLEAALASVTRAVAPPSRVPVPT